ncbi:oligosaccharide flippase family protein [Shewanella sp. DC2-4]|uniref:lipopolysaccharide biosynthesis protein n=1 Tax=Shewanella sp. DC2-4 TaxID=2739431 RepID=UPI0015641B49|nr:oligosaccharide flippase family protein [Shewanella sp. DC2-4]NRD31332.1 oligosaccharide flippase family protein [Shewanella sp. DC2-4]
MTKNSKDFLVVILGKISQVLLTFVTLKLSTSLLTPDNMGQVYLFTTIYTFFVFFLISPIGQYFNRYTHQWENDGVLLNKLYIYFCYMLFISIGATFGAYFIYDSGVVDGFALPVFVSLISLFVLVVSANQTVIPLLNMLNYRVSFTVLTFFTSLISLISSVVILNYSEKTAVSWLIGIVFGNTLILFIGLIYLKRILVVQRKSINNIMGNKFFCKIKLAEIIRFALPVSIATIFMWAQNSGYRISIENYKGAHYLGLIGIGLIVSTQLSSVVESILTQYLQPIFYRNLQGANVETRCKSVNSYLNITIPIYFALAIFLTFSIEYIFPVLVSLEYKNASIYCIYGVWIEFFRMMCNSISVVSHSELKMKGYMYSYVIGALFTNSLVYYSSTLSLSYDFIPLSLVIGALATFIVMFINMKKNYDFFN